MGDQTFKEWQADYLSEWRSGPLNELAQIASEATGKSHSSCLNELVAGLGLGPQPTRLSIIRARHPDASGRVLIQYKDLMNATRADVLAAAAFIHVPLDGEG